MLSRTGNLYLQILQGPSRAPDHLRGPQLIAQDRQKSAFKIAHSNKTDIEGRRHDKRPPRVRPGRPPPTHHHRAAGRLRERQKFRPQNAQIEAEASSRAG